MKNIFRLVIFFIPCLSFAQSWTQKADFGNSARRSAVAISIGDKGYAGTGYNGTFYKDWWEYDPVADIWTQKADFGGTARFSAVAFTIDTLGYVGTGYDVNNNFNTSDFYAYNATANTWSPIASMSSPRRYAVGFSINAAGYVGTGVNDLGYLKDFYQYDPASDTWMQKADFPGAARYECVAFALKGRGYIGIGAFANILYHDFYEYSPETDTWTQRADYPGSGQDAAFGFAINSKGYIGGGSDQQNSYSDFWEWDAASNVWTQLPDFGGSPRAYGTGVAIAAHGYAGLGEQANYYKDWWEYIPDTTAIPTAVGFLTENNFLLIVQNGDQISIHHNFSNASFHLYDLSGKEIDAGQLNESNRNLILDGNKMGRGIFLYGIFTETGKMFSGKLLLQ